MTKCFSCLSLKKGLKWKSPTIVTHNWKWQNLFSTLVSSLQGVRRFSQEPYLDVRVSHFICCLGRLLGMRSIINMEEALCLRFDSNRRWGKSYWMYVRNIKHTVLFLVLGASFTAQMFLSAPIPIFKTDLIISNIFLCKSTTFQTDTMNTGGQIYCKIIHNTDFHPESFNILL